MAFLPLSERKQINYSSKETAKAKATCRLNPRIKESLPSLIEKGTTKLVYILNMKYV